MTSRSFTPPSSPDGRGWRDFMDIALQEAFAAAKKNETPVGAALFTLSGNLVAKAGNSPISLNDPTAHAEVLCLRAASERLGNYRLSETFMAVTMEPCLMCVGALVHARVDGVVFGAPDPRAGALVSNLQGGALPFTNHRMWHVGGVMQDECSAVVKRFFLEKRKR